MNKYKEKYLNIAFKDETSEIAFADMHFEAVVYLRICNNDIIINTQTFCVIISSFLYVYKVYNICYCCYLVCFSRVFACFFYVI